MSEPKTSSWVDLFGRILLSLIFLLAGIGKILNWDQTQAYMMSRGLPQVPALLGIALAVEILGGLGILFGRWTRGSAWLLFLYLIPVTLVFHSFWMVNGPEAQNQMAHFLKNISMMGALLFVAAHGPGRFSIDAVVWHAREERTERLRAA